MTDTFDCPHCKGTGEVQVGGRTLLCGSCHETLVLTDEEYYTYEEPPERESLDEEEDWVGDAR